MYQLFNKNIEYALAQIKELVENFGIDIITSSAFINMLCEGELISENYSQSQISKYLEILYQDEKQRERNLNRILQSKNGKKA